ncbi:MAG: NAD(P)-binding protein [Candidatus Aminicenantes bacterium]|nr:NAD(P)-binding protein [Candidatus Aminicenantes bacterium]
MNKEKKYKYIILGAGPSGLSFALRLLELGEDSFLILEKETEAGGLCRSASVDGTPLDMGGGHFLDVRKKNVLDFIFTYLPEEEWQHFERKSTIQLQEYKIDFPFESNIWQFPKKIQKEYLDSIAKAGCNTGQPMPEKFEDWIYWKLGDKIAADYMIPYNKKIWSIDLNRLGAYWLYKLPNVSYEDTLWSCEHNRHKGDIPAHARFLYPKNYGCGEVWKRMAAALAGKIVFDTPVRSLDFDNLIVNEEYEGRIIVNTAPWTELLESPGLPGFIKTEINRLEYASIQVTYCSEHPGTDSHWVYMPDEELSHHRIVCRCNFSAGAKGYWTETNTKRVNADGQNGSPSSESEANQTPLSGEAFRGGKSEANQKFLEVQKPFFKKVFGRRRQESWYHVNKYAYPVNTVDKPQAIKAILDWCEKKSVFGLGRWGEWEHVNSDGAVENGMNLAEKLFKETK